MNTVSIVAASCVYAFFTVCLVLVFKKAGEGWWKALIPVYNIKTLFKVMYDQDLFWGYIFTGGFLAFLSVAVLKFEVNLTDVFSFSAAKYIIAFALFVLAIALAVVFNIIISIRGAKRFGKSKGFGWGLGLLPIVFYAILAFTKSSYNPDL